MNPSMIANAHLIGASAFWFGALTLTISDNVVSVCRVDEGHLNPKQDIPSAPPLQHEHQSSPPKEQRIVPTEAASIDYALVARDYSPQSRKLQVGDVIVLKSPHDPSCSVLKRLVATEGDWVRHKSSTRNTELIRRGLCWVEGDDKNDISDSRTYGQLPVGLIKGRALACLHVPKSFSPLSISLSRY